MKAFRGPNLRLPVAETPDWDSADLSRKGLVCSISESNVLLASLRMSRRNWIYDTFPKLVEEQSTNGRGATAKGTLTHSKHKSGSCDLIIGPHTFSETNFYEIRDAPSQSPDNVAQTHLATSASHPLPIPDFLLALHYVVQTHAFPKGDDDYLREALRIYQEDWSHCSLLANATDILASQIRAGESLSRDQAQIIATAWTTIVSTNPPRSSLATPPPTTMKPFELAVEFKEAENEFWIIPRGGATLEWKDDKTATLTVCPPFDDHPPIVLPKKTHEVHDEQSTGKSPKIATDIHLGNISDGTARLLKRWLESGEKMKEDRTFFDNLAKSPRVYLGYHLSRENQLLPQLKALTQTASMKPIKRTTAVPKKSATAKTPLPDARAPIPTASTTVLPQSTVASRPTSDISPTIHTSSSPYTHVPNILTFPGASPSLGPATYVAAYPTPVLTFASPTIAFGSSASTNPVLPSTVPVKAPPLPSRARKSAPKTTKRTIHPIQCLECGAQEAPLLRGGRFCRPCCDSGKADNHPSQRLVEMPTYRRHPYAFTTSRSSHALSSSFVTETDRPGPTSSSSNSPKGPT